VLDDRGKPVRARVAIYDEPDPFGPAVGEEGGFVSASGTRRDGSFIIASPSLLPWRERRLLVESRDARRSIGGIDSLGGYHDIVLPRARPLTLSISLREPPGETARVWLDVRRLDDRGTEPWASHTLLDAGVPGRRHGDDLGGLMSVSLEETRIRTTVLVPVGRIELTVTVQPRAASGTLFNGLGFVVPSGTGPLAERALSVPNENAGALEVRFVGDAARCMPRFTLRDVGGHARRYQATTLLERGWALNLTAIPPGKYQIGSAADCVESFDVPPNGTRRVTVRRGCAVDCDELRCAYRGSGRPD
jgi:hypothetical protein